MKIAIRADGGSKIGMGHIIRTLVLAKELAKTNDVFYICREGEEFLGGISKVKEERFDVITTKSENLLNTLKQIKADMLITDSYDVDENYFNETKKMFRYTGYIDDMNLHYFNVDFIINQNIGAEELDYKTNIETKLFLGTDYIMLREEFRQNKNKEINSNISDIMITVGGADPNGVINIICDYIKELDIRFHIITTESFKKENIGKLMQLKKERNNIILHLSASMAEIMNRCDIAISSCGSTMYELSACSIPTIGVILAKNQESIAKKMHEKGLIYNLGWYMDLTEGKIIDAIKIFTKIDNRKLTIEKQKIINKNGVNNLVNKILELKEF